jgi:DNA repair protein SbcC/Rad50
MIPNKLKLHNFMSYRDTPALNFESIHTACISGDNGNGKSALVDALTWALWGQSRANSDDELIHTGQNEVEVDFEFAVNQRNYRVLRKHSKPKTARGSGQTILELQAVTPAGNKSLTGDTVSQTQQKIIQLLRMDYDTFINSAFIRQGHSDEFTTKRPADRKQVLANILQLAVYDGLENEARELSKEQDSLINQAETAVNGLKEELAQKESFRIEFENAGIQLAKAETVTNEHYQKLVGLRQEREILEAKKSQLDEISNGILNNQSNLKRWNEQAVQSRTQIERNEKLIAHRQLIEDNYKRLLVTRQQITELDRKLRQIGILKDNQHKLEMAISKAAAALNNQQAVAARRISDLERLAAGGPQIESQMRQLNGQLATLEESEKQLNLQKEMLVRIRADWTACQTRQEQLQQANTEIDEKLKLLVHTEGATCPLCESLLGPDEQRKIEAKYLAEKAAKSNEIKINQRQLLKLQNDGQQMVKDAAEKESQLKTLRNSLQSKHGNLSKTLSDILEAQNNLEKEKTVLTQIEAQLTGRQYARDEQNTLTGLMNEISAVQYDAQVHDSLRSELTQLERYEAPWHQLAEAERQVTIEKERETRSLETIAELKQKLEADSLRQTALTAELRGYSALVLQLTTAEREQQALLASQKQLQEILGGARTRLERLTEVEARLKTRTEQLNQFVRQSKILKELSQAFGKKGIQAMLIEMAIPEIETEANLLLARMTDNRMFIKIETQRENKKGEVMETLDINISDELGTRNYEMFSGGEAFRIDFAIRIALSKLLARRAGAPLPTLIIDEGFGTQDGNGIEKIKEAITSIQDDFEKILVITHINDFKDAFPVRIEVVKSADGSTMYLN